MHPQQISIAALGVGNVGSHFLTQLSALSKRLCQSTSSPVYVGLVYAANSRRAVFSADYRPVDSATVAATIAANTADEVRDAVPLDQLTAFLASAPGTTILVDNTTSPAVAGHYPAFIRAGISVVASNKKAFSGNASLFEAIYQAAANAVLRTSTAGSPVQPGHVFHESSVGAGLPIISTLKELVETGDRVVKIEGIFSGTMSFLFNQFNPVSSSAAAPALAFSAAVAKAKQEGFTEPDARDDLNGLDVARKLVILARLAGWSLETADFPVESLVPAELESCASGDDFLARLPEFDEQMEQLKTKAAADGKVIRYVGSVDFEAKKARVGMDWFDSAHPIAGIKGSDNIISFFTERYGSQPLIVQGAGAGGAVTAMGVTGDVLKAIRVTRP